MTRKELRELVKQTIKEFTGTGSSGGNATDGNNMKSQRVGGGSFKTEEDELEFYTKQNKGEGGQGRQTSGMVAYSAGNPNRARFTRF